MSIELTATEWKVTASEKVSTGEYENYTPYVEISGELPHKDTLDEESRRELKARLLGVEKDAQEIVRRASENRTSDDADWGVPKRGEE